MKKKLLITAISAAFAAPVLADNLNVTFYGQAHLAYDHYSGDLATTAAGSKNGGAFAPGASRFGVKGTEEIADGLKGFYQFETAVNLDGSSALFGAQRDSFIGLEGSYGKVFAGRLPLANQYANDANFFGGKIGDAGNFTGANGVSSRINHAVAYATPKLGGFSGLVAYVPNTNLGAADSTSTSTVTAAPGNVTTTTTSNEKAANKAASYTLRGDYAEGRLKAGVSYQSLKTDSTKSAATILALSAGYDLGIAKVAAQYVSNKSIGQVAGADQSIVAVGGSFSLSDTDIVSVQLVKAGQKGVTANTGAAGITLGYDHAWSKRTTVYAAYAKVSNDSAAKFSATGYAHGGVGAPTNGEDPSVFSAGVIHNF